MTNETPQASQTDTKANHFGARLKSAREALGLQCKDAAYQLRLNEAIITMLESDQYPADIPAMFIRGYIRSYGKLLQIPEHEIKKALEPVKSKMEVVMEPMATNAPAQVAMAISAAPVKPKPRINPTRSLPITSGNYFMQFFTYLIIFTMIGLMATWWYTHTNNTVTVATVDIPAVTAEPVKEDKSALNQDLAPTIGSMVSTMNSDISPQFIVGKSANTTSALNNVSPVSETPADTINPTKLVPTPQAQAGAAKPPQAGSSVIAISNPASNKAAAAPKQIDIPANNPTTATNTNTTSAETDHNQETE